MIVLRLCWDHFGMILGHIVFGTLWDDFEINCSSMEYFEIMFVSFPCLLASIWDHLRVVLRTCWDRQ